MIDLATSQGRALGLRRRGRFGALAAVLLVPLGSGCTAFTDYNNETEDARDAFERGDFNGAVSGYKENLDALNDSLLYHFEAAEAAHVGGMYDESMRLFEVAYRKLDEYQTRALAADAGQVAASILVNEKTISYTGAVFEQIMLQAYQARNYYLANKRDGVSVEVRRCYHVIERARQIYEKELRDAEQESSANHEGVDVAGVEAKMRETYDTGDLNDAEDVYEINYVRYLNAFLREAVGADDSDWNEAWVDIRHVAKRFGDIEFIQRDNARLARKSGAYDDAKEIEQRCRLQPLPPNVGSVALFFECGLAPRKEELKIYFPTLHGAAAMAMPIYRKVPNPAESAVLVVGDQQMRTTTLSSLQSIAFRYQKDRLPLLIAKQIIRLAAKIAIQEGGHAVIANNGGEDAQLAAAVFSIGTSIWNIASEQADLRAWRTLPQTLQATRLYLPEGEYPARILLLGPGGNTLRELDLGTITIKADKHRLINARSIGTNLFVDVSAERYDGQAGPSGPATVTQDLRRADAPREQQAPVETTETRDQRRPDAQPERQPAARETSETRDARRPDATTPAQDPLDPGSGSSLDRLARVLQPGHPLCLQMTFNGKGGDVAMNTTVDEVRDETDAQGRRLVIMTANYAFDGVPHYFSFVVRESGIDQIDLMAAPNGAWAAVSQKTFWFKPIPGGELRFEGAGRAIASRRGVCNLGRDSKARHQASVYLRTYHVDGAGELLY